MNPPLTRRRILASSSAVTAGLTFAPIFTRAAAPTAPRRAFTKKSRQWNGHL